MEPLPREASAAYPTRPAIAGSESLPTAYYVAVVFKERRYDDGGHKTVVFHQYSSRGRGPGSFAADPRGLWPRLRRAIRGGRASLYERPGNVWAPARDLGVRACNPSRASAEGGQSPAALLRLWEHDPLAPKAKLGMCKGLLPGLERYGRRQDNAHTVWPYSKPEPHSLWIWKEM